MMTRGQFEKWTGKRFFALLSQAGTAAPTAKILNNSLGSVVFARTGVGTYTATLTGAFTADKTAFRAGVYDQATGKMISAVRTSANVLTLTHGIAAGAASDVFTDVLIEINVFS